MTRYSKVRSHGAVMLNLRMEKVGGGSASVKEREVALEKLIDNGTVPRGWKMAAISWQNPKSGTGWKRGGSKDLDKFLPVLRAVGLSGLRMAPVETGPARKPTKRERQKIVKLKKQLAKAGAVQAKAQRALSRSKLPETRRRHRAAARRARDDRLGFSSTLTRLYETFAPPAEYEVAVDYGKRKGRR